MAGDNAKERIYAFLKANPDEVVTAGRLVEELGFQPAADSHAVEKALSELEAEGKIEAA